MLSRRRFLGGLAVIGAADLLQRSASDAADESRLETTRIRLVKIPGICIAPQYVAGELLKAEGFTDVQYVETTPAGASFKALAAGQADISIAFITPFIARVDAGDPIVILAGIHAGCYDVYGTGSIRSLGDLKGKRVAVPALESPQQLFAACMAHHYGVSPSRDIQWMFHTPPESMRLLAEGKIDAMVAFPPITQELRDKKIGHLVISSSEQRPWSQHFCCIVAGNREFTKRAPVAAKRALRAVLKASTVCTLEPEKVAQGLVERGQAANYEYALETLKDLPYNRWRDYDTEDSVRFFAGRLHEAGMIKSDPVKIIAQGTDWRFLDDLKRELKN